MRQLRPFDRQVGQAAVAPYEAEDALDRVDGAQSQAIARRKQRQRVERMLVRHLERYAEPLRLPDDEAIGERALARDFGRALLPVGAEQPAEAIPDL